MEGDARQGTVQGHGAYPLDVGANQRLGILIKDVDTGLVDFPHMREEREVYLCWRLGEPKVEFWHDVDSGFSGRQPL